MKLLSATRTLSIPAGVTVEIKGRRVRVKGPRGTLVKDFKHLDVDAYLTKDEEGKTQLKVDVWFGNRATLAAIRTLCSHVQNLISACLLPCAVSGTVPLTRLRAPLLSRRDEGLSLQGPPGVCPLPREREH